MLEFYIESDLKLRHVRQCPVGEHLDRFAGWLHAVGYKRRPAQLTLRGAAHLGYWASQHGVPIERFDEEVIDAFSRHLCTCVCAHAFEGRDHYYSCGARRFVEHLRTVGVVASIVVESKSAGALVERFNDWMRQHRGVTQSTLTHYVPLVEEFLGSLGDDASAYDASRVRAFIFARASRHGHARTKSVVNAIRMFLRFLAAYGYCSPELIAAVPSIAQWKLSALPRYIGAEYRR